MAVAVGLLAWAGAMVGAVVTERAEAASRERPRVILAVLPNGSRPADLASVRGLALGLMSAGLVTVGAEQTYLDIGQGNRVFGGLYDARLPFLLPLVHAGERVDGWDEVVARARSAPAEIVPGLLASTLRRAGIAVRAEQTLLTPALVAADERGLIVRTAFCGVANRCAPGVTVEAVYTEQLSPMIARLRDRDLLVAIERAPPLSRHELAIAVAGAGFRGGLISASTRLHGVVLATDVAPTILARFGVPAPSAMLGRPIHSEGRTDAAGLTRLDVRLARIGARRSATIGDNLTLWLLFAGLATIFAGRRGARLSLSLLALAGIYMPALLLLTAALEPTPGVERLIVGLGAPALAALTLRLVPGYGAFAVACAATVGAYAADMLAGSKLTPTSLLGPNPMLGVRFYGIGNELEATLTVALVTGTGAALTAWWPRREPRAKAAVFLAAAAAATAVFAPSRFGADVGAAIVMPAGGAIAALSVLGVRGKRLAALAVAAPVAGVAALLALDALIGGESHFGRSVLHAGSTRDIGDVLYRRLDATLGSFSSPLNEPFLLLTVAGLIGAAIFRRRIAGWFAGRPAARAAYAGAIAATVLGTFANDSGALILIIGVAYIAAFAVFAWAQQGSDP